MKIAIAAEKIDLDSNVCPTAGRAPYYLIFENSKMTKTIENPFAAGRGGAGNGVAQMLSDENVELVVSGNFGEKMIEVLDEKNIKHKSVSNIKINEVIEQTE